VGKLALAAVVGAAVLMGAAPSPAQRGSTERDAVAWVCGPVSTRLTYLFWPHGHSGLPSALPPPDAHSFSGPSPDLAGAHLSVYRVGRGYPDSKWLLTLQIVPPAESFNDVMHADRRQFGDRTDVCGLSHGAQWKREIAHERSTKKATALTCTFRSKYGYIGFGPTGEPYKIRAHDKYRVFLEADTTRAVPKLRYDASFCKRIPLPGRG
jgi:hypothetical protein